jgi:hypothetical protein
VNRAETKRCGHCTAQNPEHARFCSRCGRAWDGVWIRPTTRVTPVVLKWRQLRPRLTRKEVRTLLGEPARVETAFAPDAASREHWNYEYEVVGQPARITGDVWLDLEEGTVRAWSEPHWPDSPPNGVDSES